VTKVWSDATDDRATAALFAEVWAAIFQLQTARSAEATTIGEGGITVEDDASVVIRGGGDLVVEGSGSVFVRGTGGITLQEGAVFVSQYPGSGRPCVYSGTIIAGDEAVGFGLLVEGDSPEKPDIFTAQQRVDGTRIFRVGTSASGTDSYVDEFEVRSKLIDVRSSGAVDFRATGTGLARLISQAGQAFLGGATGTFLQPQSGSGTANVRMDTTTGQITWVASTERVKTAIEDLQVDPAAVLQLRPRTWMPGPVPMQCPEWAHSQHTDEECRAGELVAPPEDAQREVGFVAEELDALGLTDFVEYDPEGLPVSIRYDRVSAALVPVVQAQAAQITALQDALAALAERVTALEPTAPVEETP
jgi:hypothetical protein